MNASSNKEIAQSFLQQVTSGHIQEVYDAYVGRGFRHHNPFFKGDADALREGMQENESKFPHKQFEIQHVLTDGDLVAVHSHLKMGDEMEIATLHLFRFADGKIVELWDIGQPVPRDGKNEHGMF